MRKIDWTKRATEREMGTERQRDTETDNYVDKGREKDRQTLQK